MLEFLKPGFKQIFFGGDDRGGGGGGGEDQGAPKFDKNRQELEAAGYTVSQDGRNVYTSTGQVAGQNWSGSREVDKIVAGGGGGGGDKPAPVPQPARRVTPAPAPVAPRAPAPAPVAPRAPAVPTPRLSFGSTVPSATPRTGTGLTTPRLSFDTALSASAPVAAPPVAQPDLARSVMGRNTIADRAALARGMAPSRPPTSSTLRAKDVASNALDLKDLLSFEEATKRTMAAGVPPGNVTPSPEMVRNFGGLPARLGVPPVGTPTPNPPASGITSVFPRASVPAGNVVPSADLLRNFGGLASRLGTPPTGTPAGTSAPRTPPTRPEVPRAAPSSTGSGILSRLAPTAFGRIAGGAVGAIFAPDDLEVAVLPRDVPVVGDSWLNVGTDTYLPVPAGAPLSGQPSLLGSAAAPPAAEPTLQRAPDRRFMDDTTMDTRAGIAAAGMPTVAERLAYVNPDGTFTDLGATEFSMEAVEGDIPTTEEQRQVDLRFGPVPVPGQPVAAEPVPEPEPTGGGAAAGTPAAEPPVAGTEPVPEPEPAPTGIATVRAQPTADFVPGARPETITLPTRDMGTVDISFEDYAALPRDPEGFVMLTSPEAEALDLDIRQPYDYGTPEGYATEDALYFGENNLRQRMAEEPGFIERMLRSTAPGRVIAPLTDREQQIVYNQLVQGPNYRGTPFEPDLMGSLLGVFGDQSVDPDAAEYVGVVNSEGQIVGSLALDADNNPIGYRGIGVTDPELLDPNVDLEAARDFIPTYDDNGNEDGDGYSGSSSMSVDPCPEGYVYDPTTESCVMVEATPEAPAPPPPGWSPITPQVPGEVVYEVGGPYTQVPGLMPPVAPPQMPPFNFQRQPVAPINVGSQAGLASLRVT